MTSITIVFRTATGKLLKISCFTCSRSYVCKTTREKVILCIVFDFREGKRKYIQILCCISLFSYSNDSSLSRNRIRIRIRNRISRAVIIKWEWRHLCLLNCSLVLRIVVYYNAYVTSISIKFQNEYWICKKPLVLYIEMCFYERRSIADSVYGLTPVTFVAIQAGKVD